MNKCKYCNDGWVVDSAYCSDECAKKDLAYLNGEADIYED